MLNVDELRVGRFYSWVPSSPIYGDTLSRYLFKEARYGSHAARLELSPSKFFLVASTCDNSHAEYYWGERLKWFQIMFDEIIGFVMFNQEMVFVELKDNT